MLDLWKQQTFGALKSLGLSSLQVQAEIQQMLEAVGLSREATLRNPQHSFSAQQSQQLAQWVQARTEHRLPLQYLLGQAWFYGRPFGVAPGVLIPRPETELLVETVLSWVYLQAFSHPFQWVDVGTGSGCIAVTLALELKERGLLNEGVGVDISPQALTVAEANAHSLGVDTVQWRQQSWLNGEAPATYDVIVSNPPYIAPKLAPTLSPEVLNHEPPEALFSPVTQGKPDPEGLSAYSLLVPQAAVCLKPQGLLAVEVGQGQAPAVEQLFREAGFSLQPTVADYAGIARVVWGTRVV